MYERSFENWAKEILPEEDSIKSDKKMEIKKNSIVEELNLNFEQKNHFLETFNSKVLFPGYTLPITNSQGKKIIDQGMVTQGLTNLLIEKKFKLPNPTRTLIAKCMTAEGDFFRVIRTNDELRDLNFQYYAGYMKPQKNKNLPKLVVLYSIKSSIWNVYKERNKL